MSHSPDFTRAEFWAIVIMSAAMVLAYTLVALVAEVETRRSTLAWPPHAAQGGNLK